MIIINIIQFTIIIKRGLHVSNMLCLNGNLLDHYIYVNYSILYSYGTNKCLSETSTNIIIYSATL